MKVKLTSKVNRFGINGAKYVPGDIFDVPEQYFRDDFMVPVDVKVELPEPLPPTELQAEAGTLTVTPPPTKKRAKADA